MISSYDAITSFGIIIVLHYFLLSSPTPLTKLRSYSLEKEKNNENIFRYLFLVNNEMKTHDSQAKPFLIKFKKNTHVANSNLNSKLGNHEQCRQQVTDMRKGTRGNTRL